MKNPRIAAPVRISQLKIVLAQARGESARHEGHEETAGTYSRRSQIVSPFESATPPGGRREGGPSRDAELTGQAQRYAHVRALPPLPLDTMKLRRDPRRECLSPIAAVIST